MTVGGDVACFDGILNKRPTLAELWENVRVDANKWYKFGAPLDLGTNKLDNIKQQYNESDI